MIPPELPTFAQLLSRTDGPPGSSWGLFGAEDQVGTLNFLELGDLPTAGSKLRGQSFSLDLPFGTIEPSLAPTRRPYVHHQFQRTPFHRDEWLDGFFPQYGSQIDGLRHIAHPDHGFYNGADPRELVAGGGPLSIHSLSALPIAGRATLVDVARFRESVGRPISAERGDTVSLADIERTIEWQGSALDTGDILLIRFGWLDWYRHRASPAQRAALVREQLHPGLEQSWEIVAWLWDQRISLVASDNFALECWPARPGSPFFTADEIAGHVDPHAGIMHRALIGLLGMPIGELWNLDPLAEACAADGDYSFLVTVAPLPLPGGAGSPANAIAIR